MNQTLRVLIVDDEASQRAGLAGMVTAWGMMADTASDGVEALEKLAQIPVDVILTDLNMPGMDGFELLDKLRGMGDSPPTIVLTAYGSVDAAVEAMKRGAYDFVTKPVNIDQLELRIRRALKSRDIEKENVDLKQQVPFVDKIAFLERGLHNKAGDTGADVDGLECIQATGEVLVVRDLIADRRRDDDLNRFLGALGRRLVTTGSQAHQQGRHQKAHST